MSRFNSIVASTTILVAACTSDLTFTEETTQAAKTHPATPITPRGVYAHVQISKAIADGYSATGTGKSSLRGLYDRLLANPAVSGLIVGVQWEDVEPIQGAFEIATVDAAFDAAVAANRGQTIVLNISPGTHTPTWLFYATPDHPPPITSCDGWFDGGTAAPDCGWVTFERYPEQHNGPPAPWPVPWSATYQTASAQFFAQIAQHYSSNAAYAPLLAGISIAGPTGASPEMIYPNTNAPQPAGGATTGWTDPDIWNLLVTKQRPNQVGYNTPFVEAWNTAIDTFANTFDGITIILTPDNGQRMLELPVKSVSSLAAIECEDGNVSCQAVTNVINHLFGVTTNAIGLLTGGMTASSAIVLADGKGTGTGGTRGDIGVPGIKYVLAHPELTSVPIVGGSEFDHALTDGVNPSTDLRDTGCPPNACSPNLTIEQGMYNVLSVMFYATPAATDFAAVAVQPQPAPSPPPTVVQMSYLGVSYEDIIYATNVAVPTKVNTGCVTAQYMLSLSSYYLLGANGTPPARPTCL